MLNVKKIICLGYVGLIKGIYFLYFKNVLLGIFVLIEIFIGILIIGIIDVIVEEFLLYI